jgi:NitT/TauT family transport system permease protein
MQDSLPLRGEPAAVQAAVRKEQTRQTAEARLEVVLTILIPLAMLALWELGARSGLLDVRFFAAPSIIASAGWGFLQSGELLGNLVTTAARILAGFSIGATLGTTCGLLMGRSETVRAALYPLISTLYPIPKITLLPLLLMAFGFSEPTRFLPAALSSFFITSVSTLGGVIAVRQGHLDVARDLGATRLQTYATVVIPTALPMIFGGLRLAWGIATITTISVELVAAKTGLGAMLWAAWQVFSMAQVFVALVTIAAFGLLTFGLMDAVQSRLIRWRM